MKIDIRGHHLAISEELRAYTERRLHFALRHFATRVLHITVQLADVNGPRGGIDKQCRIAVVLSGAGQVRVETLDNEISSAIDRAADRIQHTVTRELERRQGFSFPRSVPRRLPAAEVFRRQSQLERYGSAMVTPRLVKPFA